MNRTGLTDDQLRAVGLGHLVETESPYDALDAQKAAQRAERGKEHGLSEAEVAAADQHELSLKRYAALKNVRNIADYEKLEAELGGAE